MNQKRIKELLEDYQKAVSRLDESLNESLSKGSIVIDGTIQRFEFTFELAWKVLKAALEFQGIGTATPRSAIKEAFRAQWIKNGQGWIDMLEDRNKTSHIYNEKQAAGIYKKIKKSHYPLLLQLSKHLKLQKDLPLS